MVQDAILQRPRRTRYVARSGDGWAKSPSGARRDIAWFRDGRFGREVHRARFWPAATILRRLREAGFRARAIRISAKHALCVAVT